jgi:PAS domain-containing protein
VAAAVVLNSHVSTSDLVLVWSNALFTVLLVGSATWRLWTSRHQMRGIPNLIFLNAAATLWCLASILSSVAAIPTSLFLILQVLSTTAASTAAVLIAWQITAPTLTPPRTLYLVFVAVPVLLSLLALFGVGTPTDLNNIIASPLAILVLAYCVVLVLASLTMLARRYRDEDSLVRRSMPAFQILIVLVALAWIRDYRVPSLLVAVAALAVIWMSTRAAPWISRSVRHERLLDEIGAYVFVFDRDGRLTSWNGPAADLLEKTDTGQVTQGAPAQSVLGVDVPFTGRLDLEFAHSDGNVYTQGYTTQSLHPNPRARWVVVLRPASPAERRSTSGDNSTIATLNLDSINEETGTLGRASILERVRRYHANRESIAVIRIELVGTIAAEAVNRAMRELAIGLATLRGGIIIGRAERLVLLALLPDPAEASEISVKLRARFDDFEGTYGATLAVTALSASKRESIEDFIRRVLTPPELIDRVKWQPRWY